MMSATDGSSVGRCENISSLLTAMQQNCITDPASVSMPVYYIYDRDVKMYNSGVISVLHNVILTIVL